MSNSDVLHEMARWRLAYDTVSALAARISGERRAVTTYDHHGDDRAAAALTIGNPGPEDVDNSRATVGGACSCVGNPSTIAEYNTRVIQRDDDVIGASDHRRPTTTTSAASAAEQRDTNRNVTTSIDIDVESRTTLVATQHYHDRDVSSSVSSQLVLGENVIASEVRHLPDFRSAVLSTHVPRSNDGTLGVPVVTIPFAGSVAVDGVSGREPGNSIPLYARSSTPLRPGLVLPATDELHPSPFPFEADTLVELFDRLTDTFYSETFLWIYLNAVGRPSSRRLRHRLRLLGAASGRSLAQATVNVLTGYLTGYRQSRLTLSEQVETALRQVSSSGNDVRQQQQHQLDRASRLGRLAVELGVALNPRQMFRSFSAVVRDLLSRTSATSLGATASGGGYGHRHGPQSYHNSQSDHSARGHESRQYYPLHRATEPHHWQPHHHRSHHHHQQPQQQQDLGSAMSSHVMHDVLTTTYPERRDRHLVEERVHAARWRRRSTSMTYEDDDHVSGIIPPPPPPYPSFLLHFLTMLATPSASLSAANQTTSAEDAFSYEALLALGDQLGEVKRHGLTNDIIHQLPVYVFGLSDVGQLKSPPCDTCVICLEKFDSGQPVRVLPCRHEYHAKCVDRWLQINGTCPVCRQQVGV